MFLRMRVTKSFSGAGTQNFEGTHSNKSFVNASTLHCERTPQYLTSLNKAYLLYELSLAPFDVSA